MLDQTKPHAAQRPAAANGALRLLAIDDDSLHRMIICRIAAKAGFAPAGAATYAEAMKLAQKTPFDCITIDLSLGRHGGIELLNYLWLAGCRAEIIVVGGCDGENFCEAMRVAASLNLRIRETMTKPADFAVLHGWLDALKTERAAAAVAAA
jgi:two-component system, chemotaxis family, chemotaxis protein CheY